MDQQTLDLAKFRKLMMERFSLEELKNIISDLKEDWEDIVDGNNKNKVREILHHFRRRDKLHLLLAAVKAERPSQEWPFHFDEKSNAIESTYSVDRATEIQRQISLEQYLDKISNLILLHGLAIDGDAHAWSIAKGLTVATMSFLDSQRNRQLIQFLRDCNLLEKGGLNFERADLSDANLQEIIFQDVSLPFVNFMGASLQGALLEASNLGHSNISNANLTGANLVNSNFDRSKFDSSNLTKADFGKSNLSAASFRNVIANFAGFHRADLTRTDFSGSELRNVSFYGARLNQTNFSGTQLDGANFYSTVLRGIDFTGASLVNTSFESADLVGAIIAEEQLESAEFDRWTIMPNGIQRNDMPEFASK